jgi:hypothetical protein
MLAPSPWAKPALRGATVERTQNHQVTSCRQSQLVHTAESDESSSLPTRSDPQLRTGENAKWKSRFLEGLNNKIRVLQRRAYGFRDQEHFRLKVFTCMLPAL